jgi:hypothetical protein
MSFKSNISRYVPKSREVSQNQSPSQDAFVLKGNGSEVEQLREKVIELENDLREIAKKDQAIISDLKSQLEDAICAKADMSKKLAESFEVSKTLKEGKEELFMTVLNLNERLETQNKMTTEAQSVFLKLPAAIRALKRLDDETVVLRKEKLQQEIELENQKKIAAEYERMMADMKGYNDKYGEEVKAMQGQLVDQLSAFKIVKVTLEKASAAASTKDSANYEALQKQYEESKATIDADRLIFATEREMSDEELRKLHCQLETRMHLFTLQSPKHTDTQLVQTVVEEPYLRIIDDVKYRLFKSENERRTLHKQLQALRGNIRVTVRCRPYINHDGVDTLALDNASQTNDSRICGGIRFFKDGTSISLAGSINVRDKPQVKQ